MKILVVYTLFLVHAWMISASTLGNHGSSAEVVNELRAKLEELEMNQKSLQDEVSQLREQTRAIGISTDQSRTKRDAAQPLPGTGEHGCIPGTNGCPVSVTPFSVGSSCILCPAGPRGYPGPVGSPGRDGRDGRDAVAIVTANEGVGAGGIPPWTGGPTQYGGPPSNTTGAVYVRWGHSECPSTSALIYTGVTAGPTYGGAGNGANQLCLPKEGPIYDEPVAGVGPSRASLYGVEYQIDAFPARNDRIWHDVPCAVCKAPSRFAHMVVPGRNVCPSSEWTLEYGGYLMAERSHTSHKRSMYICVDREMQTVDRAHGAATLRGLLDLVEGRCSGTGGGIPCGPYIDGHELTCAVCTQ